MLEGFEHLSSQELDALMEAPVLITVLIGAADGNLDRDERHWSDRLVQVKTYSKPQYVTAYYKVVAENFLQKVDQAIAALPEGVEERSALIKSKLEALNPVLAKLEGHLGATLYKSYVGLAAETAKASGGVFRIGAISAAEYQWIELPMLTPIEMPVGDADTEEED
ncbi:MAG: hypothetical protein IPL65_18365 [Lewinellaceae bacterium]|nr:hypothetical protein [Lewinellaceae bacterium]